MGIDRDGIREQIAQVLGRGADDIGDDDDLIALGLDSIRMMRIAGGWRKLGHDVNFAQLAAAPTVADWHAALGGGDPAPPAATLDTAAADFDTAAADFDTAAADFDAAAADFDAAEPFALAPMQHAYWIGRGESQDLGGVAAHLYVEFEGPDLDPERLARAVDDVITRHPMLRARFLPDGRQQILPEPGVAPLTVLDLREAADTAGRLERLRETKTHQRMRVADGQVIDIVAVRLPGGRARLCLDVDMLAADAMSYRILVSDLARRYRGETLTPIDYTFARYRADRQDADRQRADHATGAAERDRDRAWWRERLDDLPTAPVLPVRARAAEQHRTVRHHHRLEPEAKARLLAAAHERGVTPAMALASVFAEVIGRWSAEPRFLLNLPLFHRDPVHPQIDEVVGDFTSSVLLDVDVRAQASVLERARTLQQTLHANGSHSAYGGLEVLRDLGRARGEQVLASVVYTSALNLGELFDDAVTQTFGEPVWIVSQGPQVLLDAQVTELRGGLLLNWDVRADAFPEGMVEEMFTQYTAAVSRLGEGEAGWRAQAAPQLPRTQREVRSRVNATAAAFPARTLHESFFVKAAANPQAPALLWGADRTLSYADLARRALGVAAALEDAGVGPGDAVAIQLPKGPDQVTAALGVLCAGAVYVPIGFDQPASRRARILATADAVAAIGADAGQFDGTGVPALVLAAAQDHSPAAAPIVVDPESVAYVLFTSGSTGEPKGVEVPHRAAMNTIEDLKARFAVGPADRALAVSALEFDLSVYDIFGLLAAGGAVVALDDTARNDPAAWAHAIRAHRVSVLNCVPSILDMLLTQCGADQSGALDSLRVVLLGGDTVGADLPRRLAAAVPRCRFAGLGGTTETAIHSTVCEVTYPPAEWLSVPYGTPLHNVSCRVVDPRGEDCPDWVTGELWIGGAGVAHGYRNDPERTAERFLDDAGQRWYRTGDLARYLPDGTLEFLGRADHQVKIRGHRVELGEVEGMLRALPAVHRALATVVGGASARIAAAVTLVAPATPGALIADLADALPGYMVPSRVVVLDEFPLTPNGKLDRAAVRRILESDPDDTEFVAPSGELETALADLFATVLGGVTVGGTDDFFALGGDSVLATAVVARVREWLDAPHAVVADIFAARTVAGLAARLRAGDTDPDRLEQVARIYLEVAAMGDDEILEHA